ncbi:hypothetical protein AYI68_g8127 [Smittium mucronatum]|uniref:Uncharacterized protein n=1 Tax=Smittium mucronatum TaxID=133383 RepID=A0A1R0GLS5_9FUNG|nr:hypothetical protein AYI68_g8127 [Smittium mucronatum]
MEVYYITKIRIPLVSFMNSYNVLHPSPIISLFSVSLSGIWNQGDGLDESTNFGSILEGSQSGTVSDSKVPKNCWYEFMYDKFNNTAGVAVVPRLQLLINQPKRLVKGLKYWLHQTAQIWRFFSIQLNVRRKPVHYLVAQFLNEKG